MIHLDSCQVREEETSKVYAYGKMVTSTMLIAETTKTEMESFSTLTGDSDVPRE